MQTNIYTHVKMEKLDYPVGDDVIKMSMWISQIIILFKQLFLEKAIEDGKLIAIWCRGSSGAMLASTFAIQLSPLISSTIKIRHIKKSGEIAHGNYVSDFNKDDYNIVIDDFVSSGETIYQIINKSLLIPSDHENDLMDLLIVSEDISLYPGKRIFRYFKEILCGGPLDQEVYKAIKNKELDCQVTKVDIVI